MSTVIDLRGRHLMKLADFSPEEITYLLDLAAELKAAKREGREEQKLVGKEIALIFEKDSTRTRCAFEVAAYDQGAHVTFIGPVRLAHGPQGDRQGHGPRARPDVRRDRVPRLRPGHGRGARAVGRRARLQRAHRRVAPDPDPGRLPDLPRAPREAARRGRRSATSATPASTWPTPTSSAARSSAWTCGSRARSRSGRATRSSPSRARPRPRPARRSRSPTTSPRPCAAPTCCSPTCGSRWASPTRSGRSGSSCSRPTR